MSIKERAKTYNFWVSITSAIILILKILGNKLGFTIDETLASDLITSVCSIFVLLGIIVPPSNKINTATLSNKLKQSESITKESPENKPQLENILLENKSDDNTKIELKQNELQVIEVVDDIQQNTHESIENTNTDELYTILEYQKSLYLGNIDAYVAALQKQIDNIRKI